MLGRQHRFHGYNSLKATYTHGSAVRSSFITVKYNTRETQKPYRVAVVVSKKVSKSAVVRNRIRRRLFEAIRRQAALLAPGTDIVMTVFNDQVATMDAPKLEALVTDLLQKLPVKHR